MLGNFVYNSLKFKDYFLFMSQILSSAYAGLAKLLLDAGHFINPAELQGNLWGRTVAGANVTSEQLLTDMAMLLDEGELTESLKQAITGLQEMINKELVDGSVAVTLLLPNDDVALNDRLQAIIEWGQGFLSGFGMVKAVNSPSAEVMEILQDIAAITQLELMVAVEDEARSEGDYMELVEFLRVAPLLVATELNLKSLEKDVATTSKAIH